MWKCDADEEVKEQGSDVELELAWMLSSPTALDKAG